MGVRFSFGVRAQAGRKNASAGGPRLKGIAANNKGETMMKPVYVNKAGLGSQYGYAFFS
jgi:hypothetical protein